MKQEKTLLSKQYVANYYKLSEAALRKMKGGLLALGGLIFGFCLIDVIFTQKLWVMVPGLIALAVPLFLIFATRTGAEEGKKAEFAIINGNIDIFDDVVTEKAWEKDKKNAWTVSGEKFGTIDDIKMPQDWNDFDVGDRVYVFKLKNGEMLKVFPQTMFQLDEELEKILKETQKNTTSQTEKLP